MINQINNLYRGLTADSPPLPNIDAKMSITNIARKTIEAAYLACDCDY